MVVCDELVKANDVDATCSLIAFHRTLMSERLSDSRIQEAVFRCSPHDDDDGVIQSLLCRVADRIKQELRDAAT
tara:strand:- start:51 stop:272 length:222 start_codon:yes stop_codon:yes gene_type:complete